VNRDCSKAAVTSAVVIDEATRQPSIRREYTSTTNET
jgi:hypothetical protein